MAGVQVKDDDIRVLCSACKVEVDLCYVVGKAHVVSCPQCGGQGAFEKVPNPPGQTPQFLEIQLQQPQKGGVGLESKDLRPQGAPETLEVKREDPKTPDLDKGDAEFHEGKVADS